MNTIQKIKSYIDNARNYEQASNGVALKYHQDFHILKRQIEQNTDLSQEGQSKAVEAARKEMGLKLMKDAYTTKQLYLNELKKAQRLADSTAYKKPKVVDPVKLERFTNDLNALKTEVMLTGRVQTAQAKIQALVDRYIKSPDDRQLAEILRGEFAELSSHILNVAGQDREKVRMQLAETFDRLESDFTPQEVKDARNLLDLTNRMIERGKVFSLTATQSMTATFGREVGDNLNTPEKYFETRPEEKPADPVDPELKKAEKETEWERMMTNMHQILQEKIESGELKL
jgi:hypothetical protein